ncbi:ubiquitin carboxyl-terminal hydrolase 15 isoform X2 [Ricinus communis]|uniref:ubiquitin carboxyl-terminal hydrolase 15 isoform X2 n=1 Tax=Ricinus communis TaxID=3988 RepID=UPI00201A34F1|nr:ubiquitin carboxyl-terminal hydrolase 15 isoform X2 [Ricinus communis]
MLEPREADMPVLFMVLVVLPLVVYILLGKWSEATRKRERISLLAELAAEEALRAQAIKPIPISIPFVSTTKNGIHVCARCLSPAATRCSRCKSVRYCSGNCQIIHWRQVHKQECQQLETTSSCSSPKATSIQDSFPERGTVDDSLDKFYSRYSNKQVFVDNITSDKTVHPSISNGVSAASSSAVETSQDSMLRKISTNKYAYRKSRGNLEETSGCGNLMSSNIASDVHINGHCNACTKNVLHDLQPGKMFESRNKSSCANAGKNGRKIHETETDFTWNGGNMPNVENNLNDQTVELNCSYEAPVMKENERAKCASQPTGTKISKSSKSTMKVFAEPSYTGVEEKGLSGDDSKDVRMRHAIPAPGSNGVASTGIMKMVGLRKSAKLTRQDAAELSCRQRKLMMLFPYEEFVKIFNCEVANLSPRGLLNCGNSCYANAVLQCLACTKPLIIFLLHRSHSRACCGGDWCLMCELEKHVIMLRQCGGPLSPSRILLHIQNVNCQIGDGSQEDAHEFLRLLVACMQSTCLKELGGEDKVSPVLQETTFIQHTFGGSLRSKVKCLGCHHESERYESIMDLTLEIFGWVESLEDALTQFTTPEELDGENMYRCARCATYVRARKQLSIHEAPNILTIVLKRFQVRPVPMSQVMSEGVYILFYIRSCPRPQKEYFEAIQQQVPASAEHGIKSLKTQKPSRKGYCKSSSRLSGLEPLLDLKPQNITGNINRNVMQVMEFSDSTSSDWSLFTSSDEASFTTESTRDSFSTVDYADACNEDTFSSIFDNLYAPQSSRNPLCCRKFINSRSHTRFISEERGYVLDSYLSMQQLPRGLHGEDSLEKVSDSSTECPTDSCCSMYLKCGINSKFGHDRTSGHFKL